MGREKRTQEDARVGNDSRLGGGFFYYELCCCALLLACIAPTHLHILNITSNTILKRATPLD